MRRWTSLRRYLFHKLWFSMERRVLILKVSFKVSFKQSTYCTHIIIYICQIPIIFSLIYSNNWLILFYLYLGCQPFYEMTQTRGERMEHIDIIITKHDPWGMGGHTLILGSQCSHSLIPPITHTHKHWKQQGI